MNFSRALELWIRANVWGLPPRRSPSPPKKDQGQDTPAGDPEPAGPGVELPGELRGPAFVVPAKVIVPEPSRSYCPIKFRFEKRFHAIWNLATMEFDTHEGWAEAFNAENQGKLGTDGSNVAPYVGSTGWGTRADGSKWSFSDVTVEGKGGRGRWYGIRTERWYYCGNTVDKGARIEHLAFSMPVLSQGSGQNITTFEKEIDDERFAWDVQCCLEIDGKMAAYNGKPTNVNISDSDFGSYPRGSLPSLKKPHVVTYVIKWGRPYRPDSSRYYEDISSLIGSLGS